MTARPPARQEPCGRPEASARLVQADAYCHREAIALVETITPNGSAMAKDLDRLLKRKDSVHYGATMISAAEGARRVSWAARLVGHARTAVEV